MGCCLHEQYKSIAGSRSCDSVICAPLVCLTNSARDDLPIRLRETKKNSVADATETLTKASTHPGAPYTIDRIGIRANYTTPEPSIPHTKPREKKGGLG